MARRCLINACYWYNSVWVSPIPAQLFNNKISIVAYLKAWRKLVALNYAGPQPHLMLPVHKYLSNTLTQEGKEKAIGPGRCPPRIRMNCVLQVALLQSWSINLQPCRSVLFCRLQALQLDNRFNWLPGLPRQKSSGTRWGFLSCVNVPDLGTNVSIFSLPDPFFICPLCARGPRLHTRPSLETKVSARDMILKLLLYILGSSLRWFSK